MISDAPRNVGLEPSTANVIALSTLIIRGGDFKTIITAVEGPAQE
jgi:hypothetical protein